MWLCINMALRSDEYTFCLHLLSFVFVSLPVYARKLCVGLFLWCLLLYGAHVLACAQVFASFCLPRSLHTKDYISWLPMTPCILSDLLASCGPPPPWPWNLYLTLFFYPPKSDYEDTTFASISSFTNLTTSVNIVVALIIFRLQLYASTDLFNMYNP